MEPMPLSKQIDFVFRKLKDELCQVNSGTVFVHIRNNEIGKFGVKHLPFEGVDGEVQFGSPNGLTELQFQAFRQMAIASLSRKRSWTHGEIFYDFTVKKGIISVSILFESNYNMSSYARTI